ncbi:MAG: M48 family peptidase, partial [Bacteroidota bacterium]|nr:M48 family peptidase [Bacteroidota bacterium]
MNYNIWFWIIIGILIFNFALTVLLNYLNIKNLKSSLPDEVSDIYDSNKYEKSQRYTKTNTKFSFITGSFSFVVILLMLFLGGFNFFDKLAIHYVGDTPITTSLFFFLFIFIGNELISLPFSIYDTFVIEKKFGFNKTTKK